MGNLTRDFSLSEFRVSESYPHLADQIELHDTDQLKLFYLCTTILQPARDFYTAPLNILSGKRSVELNHAIGGSLHSDHLYLGKSCAVDFHRPDPDFTKFTFDFLRERLPWSFGQLILYLKQDDTPNFIHVSLPTRKWHGDVKLKKEGEPYRLYRGMENE